MFSIIIPLYNKANYITKTIQCVLKQTVQSFEIIIVNDSSTDNSLNIVSNIQDERITIYTKPNGGVSSARNYGIKKAKFDYIVFLDADDLWEEDFLSSINQLIQRYPQAGMYCTGFNKIINKKQKYESIYPNDGQARLITDYCKTVMEHGFTPCWTSAICIKKNIINNVGGFPERIKAGEDLDMWLRIGLKYPIAYLSSPKAIYQSQTENNYNSKPIPLNQIFPYDKWYDYDKNNKWLYFYATHMNVLLAQSLNREQRYKEAIIVLNRCKGFKFIIKRIVYYILSLSKISL